MLGPSCFYQILGAVYGNVLINVFSFNFLFQSWVHFRYCWSQNTYFLPFTDEIPNEIAKHEQLQISYYQWTPFFMMIEALMFYFPCLMWRAMYSNTGREVLVRTFLSDLWDQPPVLAHKVIIWSLSNVNSTTIAFK